MSKPLVRLATPLANGAAHHPEYTRSVNALVRAHAQGKLPFDLQVLQMRCSHLPSGRDKLVRSVVLEDGTISADLSFAKFQTVSHYDYILFIDADQSFTTGQIVKLFNSCRLRQSPVSAVTTPRGHEHKLNVGSWEEGFPGLVILHDSFQKRGVRDVNWFGCGCVIIPTDTFSKLPFPWFFDRQVERDGCVYTTGEDVGFCLSCTDAEIKLYADYGVYVNHHTEQEFTVNTTKKPATKSPVKSAAKAEPQARSVNPQIPESAPAQQGVTVQVFLAQEQRRSSQFYDRINTIVDGAEAKILELQQVISALVAENNKLKGE